MKKYKHLLLLVVSVAVGIILWQNYKATPYDTYVSKMTKVSPQELQTINSDYMLYVGRKDCPYCQQFVEKLHNKLDNMEHVYYLDTNLYREDKEFVKLAEQQGINAVPTLLLYKERAYIKLSTPVSDEEFQEMISMIPR